MFYEGKIAEALIWIDGVLSNCKIPRQKLGQKMENSISTKTSCLWLWSSKK